MSDEFSEFGNQPDGRAPRNPYDYRKADNAAPDTVEECEARLRRENALRQFETPFIVGASPLPVRLIEFDEDGLIDPITFITTLLELGVSPFEVLNLIEAFLVVATPPIVGIDDIIGTFNTAGRDISDPMVPNHDAEIARQNRSPLRDMSRQVQDRSRGLFATLAAHRRAQCERRFDEMRSGKLFKSDGPPISSMLNLTYGPLFSELISRGNTPFNGEVNVPELDELIIAHAEAAEAANRLRAIVAGRQRAEQELNPYTEDTTSPAGDEPTDPKE